MLYLAYTMIRGPFVDWYPYPFLDPRVNGYGFVAVMSVFVAGVGLGLAWLLCWVSRRGAGAAAGRPDARAADGATRAGSR